MFELTVIEGPAKGSNVVLKDGRSVTIGTGVQADLRVGGSAADTDVVIKPLKGGGFGAKALAGSVRINGQDLAAGRLESGDVLEVGDSRIRFAPPRSTTSMPETLGGFEILGVLGKGGMGVVYRARQVSLDREVALKVLADKHAKDPEFVQRFLDEARHAAQLHHPNVVQVFDVDQADGRYFYSMELMHEGSVERRLKREGTLSVDESIRIALDAARGLAFAKETGLVHRDIKPDNLMVDRHGNVKLCDLGLARTEDEDEGKIVGTPHFMPPEQIQRKPLDHRSDLYALGCTLFRMVTGKTPFSGSNVKEILRGHLKEEPPRADEVAEGVPPALADVIERLLQKDPEDRYPSAHELVTDLESVEEPVSGGRNGLALVLVAVLVVGGLAIVLGGKDDPAPTPSPQQTGNAGGGNDDQGRAEAEQMRLELEARKALFALIEDDLPEAVRAERLEGLAERYAGTDAATEASEKAEQIRTRIAEREAIEAARAQAIATAVADFEKAFQAAIDQGDLLTAESLLADPGIEASIADAEPVRTAQANALATLETAAAEDWTARFSEIGAAFAATEYERARELIASTAGRLPSAENPGWPKPLLGDPKARRTELDEWTTRIREAERAAAREATRESWNAARSLCWESAGPIDLLRSGRLDQAASALEAGASALGDVPAAAGLRRMAQLSALGNSYVDRLRDRAGELEILTREGPRRLVSVELEGPMALAVEGADGGTERMPAAGLRDSAWPEFGDGSAERRARAAFLSSLRFGQSLAACREYLGTVRAEDEGSGIGTGLLDSVPPGTVPSGDEAPEWIAAANVELTAVRQLHLGLRALDSNRNTAAVRRLESLLNKGDDSLAVELMR